MPMVKTVAATDTATKWWEQKAAKDEATTASQHAKSIQTITFNTSSFSDKDRTFVAIASTPIVDRYGDTIDQSGWNLDNFLKNPVIPWAHDYWQPPVGRVVEIGINEQGNLQFKYQAPPKGIYPFADTIWELYRNQFMFAFSVGFNSIEADGDWQNGYDFKQCELLEISAVVVPANPQAVALAYDKGFIDQAQLKDLKSQLADGIKNIDQLIAKQVETKENKADAADVKDAAAVVKVELDQTQVKELVDSINAAADRLEAATKSVKKGETADESAQDGKGLTTGAAIEDTKGMETKAGASLSKANKEKLKACQKAFTDMQAMCEQHLSLLSEMLGDEEMETEAEKAADVTETKAAEKVEQKEGEAEKAAAEGQEQTTETTEVTEAAEGAKDNEQQQGDDDAAKGDGEVNSEADKADEGADQKAEGETDASKTTEVDLDEEVDPDNLTPEQAEKIAAAVNEDLEKIKQ